MVRWFDPLILARTGVRSVISATIGKQADRRLLDALAAPKVEPSDFSVDAAGNPRQELWLDYVSDLGDGWDSTYAVAHTVARPSLTVQDETGKTYDTHGGELLVFGGDAVYPDASVKEYEERTIQPWASAMRGQRPRPHLFAIPGNHDWYDGLVSFIRLFCQERALGGWTTHQRRSYFAVKLPHGWWLIGTDMQLESDLDDPQVQYFQEVAKLMNKDDRVILCLAEPAWLRAQVRTPAIRLHQENNLDFLQHQVLGKKVSVFLAGDLHHYRRHANDAGQQKIIAGGGGAFLHPTHAPRKQRPLPEGFTARKCFPSATESRRLCWHNLAFLKHNPRFGMLTGLLYMLLAWALSTNIGASTAPKALSLVVSTALGSPGVVIIALLIILGLIGFADARFGRLRPVVGVLHGLVHLLAVFLIAWGVSYLVGPVLDLPFRSLQRDLVSAALIFLGGLVVGPTLMGLYLLISLNVFSAHANEAFGSLSIPDWKNFVRMRIDKNGRLWLFPIGIRRVPRSWKPGSTVREPEWVPDPADKRATPPALIEPPIIV
ncbi:metallophosphoesterase [Hyalangium rubrum]|uniref:Metallophosphoesterase n=1 Tax=Hyalangium rubrum TaxID=3103134 RepID=A0ABU5HF90_9BACT|nr:metallophosphoesterase [Hyalangium sp. s54d21]MDY7231817.1 metallophosphoesterase [Hyalangium sp. s54d21]